jgi:hypothetical protein
MPSIIRATTTSGLQVAPDNSGSLELQTNGTASAVTINTSQNVGIGNTSPQFRLTTNYTANATFTNAASDFNTMWQNAGVNALGVAMETTAKVARFVTNNGYVTAFNNASTEAMRIDSNGNVGIGTTSPLNPIQTYKLGDFSSSTNNIRNLAYFQADATVANSSIIFNTNPTSGLNLRGFRIDYQSSAFAIGRFHTDKTTGFTPDLNITSDGLFQFNNGYGSVATAFGCRAWVNFNGTGTVAIRASGNVTSITDNGTGLYTVNFTAVMPDANYAMNASGYRVSGSYSSYINIDSSSAPTTSACRIASSNDTGALVDAVIISVSFIR